MFQSVAGFLLTPEEVDFLAKRMKIPPRKNVFIEVNKRFAALYVRPRLMPVCYPKRSADGPEMLWFLIVSERGIFDHSNPKLLEPGEDTAKVRQWLEQNGIKDLKFQTIFDPDGGSAPDAPRQFESVIRAYLYIVKSITLQSRG